MSEPVLKSIIRLFAFVAIEDAVTERERAHIFHFLEDHLSQPSVERHVHLFDQYAHEFSDKLHVAKENELINQICETINLEITQKQKMVVLLELMNIVLSDGTISSREEKLIKSISERFNISHLELDLIKQFVSLQHRSQVNSEDILLIDSDKTKTESNHFFRSDLDGFIAILHLDTVELYFLKYVGKTDVHLNGVQQKSGKISVLATGSSIRWGASEPVYYGSILTAFKKNNNEYKTSFEAKNISFVFKNGRLGLRNVSIAEESGNLVALMGASGAGKSTLLHVLNGNEKPSEGQVLINGIDIHKNPKKIEGVIGFVPQDDLLIEDLTVYQNLYFAAKLCFGHLSESEINRLTLKTLDDLGLHEVKDLKVGSPLQKTISGGQRKRVNIGLELLREPAVLFADEPTSGLSSRDSENIIELLKELSLKGKLIFAVIHQPSSDIFKMFDRLVILDVGGYQIYYGNPVDAITYFKRSINMINSEEGECLSCGNVTPEQIFNIIETKVIDELGNFTNERKFSPEEWNSIFSKKIKPPVVTQQNEPPHSTLNIPTWIKQTHLFSMRDILSKLSNTQYLIINLLEAPTLAFILAFIVRYYDVDDQLNVGYVFGKNLNIPAYLLMSVIVALFMGLTVSAEEIIRDRKILKREKFLHLYRGSYLVSKISILFAISGIQTFLFVLVGNYILEIKDMFLIHWAILFTTSCFANLLGLNISSAFNSAVTIYILIPILLIPQLILSGVVVKFDKLNPAIGNTVSVPTVGNLMASRWGFEAAMVSQFKDNAFEHQFYSLDKIMAESDYKKIYYIPDLEGRLDFVLINYKNKTPEIQKNVSENLQVIRNEISKELKIIGEENFKYLDSLVPEKYDSTTFVESTKFLVALKRFYNYKYTKADKEKDQLIGRLTKNPQQEKEFEKKRKLYQNEAISSAVKNQDEQNRIIEQNGKLVQKIYPIYKDPDPEHFVDFDTQFYMPAKHFLGQNIDTLYFNLSVIWLMSLVLSITLYYELLRKLIDGMGNLYKNIPKRM